MQRNKHQIQVPNVGIFWIYPPPTNSYCQDCYIVSFGRLITFHWVSSLQLELQQVGKSENAIVVTGWGIEPRLFTVNRTHNSRHVLEMMINYSEATMTYRFSVGLAAKPPTSTTYSQYHSVPFKDKGDPKTLQFPSAESSWGQRCNFKPADNPNTISVLAPGSPWMPKPTYCDIVGEGTCRRKIGNCSC